MATPDALLAEARRALAQNQLDVARQTIKRALGRAPQRVDLLAARAYIELASGERDGAASTCRQILERLKATGHLTETSHHQLVAGDGLFMPHDPVRVSA